MFSILNDVSQQKNDVSQQNNNECLLSSFLFHSETPFFCLQRLLVMNLFIIETELAGEFKNLHPILFFAFTLKRVQVKCWWLCLFPTLEAVELNYKLNLVISTLKDQHVCPSY
jgi:hypothetical protein